MIFVVIKIKKKVRNSRFSMFKSFKNWFDISSYVMTTRVNQTKKKTCKLRIFLVKLVVLPPFICVRIVSFKIILIPMNIIEKRTSCVALEGFESE